MKTKLLHVSTPLTAFKPFVAGAVWVLTDFQGWKCTQAAPIIKWMIGKSPDYVKGALQERKLEWEWGETEDA